MMQTEVTQLYGVNPQDLLTPLESIKSLLTELKELISPTSDRLLSRKEVAEMLGISISTVHNWTTVGRLKAYGGGRRVYYKSSEVENALVELKR